MDILDSSDEAAVSSVWISFHWLTEITRDPLVLWLQKGRENSRITNNHRNKTELLKWKTYIFFNVTIATPILDPCSLHLQWYVICAMCGFIAQWVEHRTGIAEVTGSNPVEALIFFFFSSFQLLKLENLLRWSLFTFMCNAVLRKVGFNSDGSFVQLNFASRIWRSMFSNFSKTCVLCSMVTALTGNKMQHNKTRPFVPIRSPSIINVWTGEVVLHEREGVSYPGAFSVSPRRKTFFCWKTRW